MAQYADSVSVCLSKGLAAPVGSLLCGTSAFIEQARRARKVLGGGMRQAGIIAAAGIVALSDMVDRLAEDHANASKLAAGIRGLQGMRLSYPARSNIVIFRLTRPDPDSDALIRQWHEHGVLILSIANGEFRAVTHHGISASDMETTLQVVSDSLAAN